MQVSSREVAAAPKGSAGRDRTRNHVDPASPRWCMPAVGPAAARISPHPLSGRQPPAVESSARALSAEGAPILLRPRNDLNRSTQRENADASQSCFHGCGWSPSCSGTLRGAGQQPPHQLALSSESGLGEGAFELGCRGVSGDSAAFRVTLDSVPLHKREYDLNLGRCKPVNVTQELRANRRDWCSS
jgi:hypothetical protein